MKNQSSEIIYGLYKDEEKLMTAIKTANNQHLDIMDVLTPFPVHGLDKVMHLEESRLHIAGFVFGSLGTITAFGGMTWIFTKDWPIIFGGKPYWSVPSFIPITFELTVLFAAIGMVVTFYTICGLGPGVKNRQLDARITDDKFCIAFDASHSSDAQKDQFKSFLSGTGAEEVHTKTFN